MQNQPKIGFYLFATLAVFIRATASEIAPTQNAEAQKGYTDLSRSERLRREKTLEYMHLGKTVSLHWDKIPLATSYLIEISGTPDFLDIIARLRSSLPQVTTPSFEAGIYYFRVTGYSRYGPLQKIPAQEFRVGKPQNVFDTTTSLDLTRKKPAPPSLLSPEENTLFPLGTHVRLSWTSNSSARSYRVRIWYLESNEEKKLKWYKHQIHPIWTTEVQQSWIQLSDIPYSSYIDLKPGHYKWDVSAIHAHTGEFSDPSQGLFEISQDPPAFKNEAFVRPVLKVDPLFFLRSNSSITGVLTQELYAVTELGLIGTFWKNPHWGAEVAGEISVLTKRFSSKTTLLASNTAFFKSDAEILYRTTFSENLEDWKTILGLGLGIQEFPHVETISLGDHSAEIARPKALGVSTLIRLFYPFTKKSLFYSETKLLFPTTVLSTPVESDLQSAFIPSSTLSVGLQNTAGCTTCFGGGLSISYSTLSFRPKQGPLREILFQSDTSYVRMFGVGLEFFFNHKF